ncbi:MAG: BamA/TamA family outer membrane protein [Cyclobacteriaceae bacterium]
METLTCQAIYFTCHKIDFRHYWKIDKKNSLVSRFMAGVGYAYGNSETLPYSMQFASGGSNSLRAFRARTVGPGSFVPQDTIAFIDQTADIKLEMNVEYRFDILGSLKGAVYVDAGNIWAMRKEVDQDGNELRPGAQFKFSNILDELAVGTGFGVRYDFQFFVIRLDLGIPIKLPYQYTENGIPRNFPVQPWKGDWLSNYLVWNLAIGYPF